MNGRIYDPLLGRFLSPDMYVQAPDFTQSHNRYSYCLNNPLMFTDPSGWMSAAELEGIRDYVWNVEDGIPLGSDIGYGSQRGGGGNPNDGAWKSYTESLASGYTGSYYKFRDNYIQQFYSHDYNGTMTFKYTIQGKNYNEDKTTYVVARVETITVNIAQKGEGSNRWEGYETVNHYGHISKFPTEALEGIVHLSLTQTAQTVRMVGSEAKVAKLIGNIGKVAKYTGVAGELVVIGANGYNVWTNPTSENVARAGISGLAIGVNALNLVVPGLGLGLSLGITAIDAAGGFDWLYDSFKKE